MEERIERICVECFQSFTIENGELEFLRDKIGPDFRPPKRCKPCRRARRSTPVDCEEIATRG